MPDVDLGIYIEDLNHKMSLLENHCHDAHLIHNLDPTMQPFMVAKCFLIPRFKLLNDCLYAELLAFITQNNPGSWNLPPLVFRFGTRHNTSDNDICKESVGLREQRILNLVWRYLTARRCFECILDPANDAIRKEKNASVTIDQSSSQLTKYSHFGPRELNLLCVSSHQRMLLALLSRCSNSPKRQSRSRHTIRQAH